MGLIEGVAALLFGTGRAGLRDMLEVFRPNAEAREIREADFRNAALAQLSAEFARERKGWFDRMVDALNRLPRPALALGTLGLFASAMVDPVWFAARMQGIALVPEPLWWLLGGIVSFYFGARHQAKGQDFQRSIALTLAQTADVTRRLGALDALQRGATGPVPANAALEEWRAADDR